MTAADVFPDILGGGDQDGLAVRAGAVRGGLAAEVGSGFERGGGNGFGPGEEVGGLLGEEAAAFFLVKEEDGGGGKAFMGGGCDSQGGVLLAEGGGRELCGFDLGVQFAVGEDEEAEAGVAEDPAFADPGGGGLAGGRGEPIAGEGEVAMQVGEAVVSRVEVAVEADEVCLFGCICGDSLGGEGAGWDGGRLSAAGEGECGDRQGS